MIYLDNAATTFPKPDAVVETVDECMRNWCANPGRAGHAASMKSGEAVYHARREIAEFIGSKPQDIIFTSNCTDALNLAIHGVLKKGDHVVTTMMEHNSVFRPLNKLRAAGVETTIVRCSREGKVRPADIEGVLRDNTRMIICTAASNVTGTIMPLKEIGEIARRNHILFLVDGSQGMGVMKIDTEEYNIDLLTVSGHKSLMGPQGTGFLYVRSGTEIRPVKEGGTGTESWSIQQPQTIPEGFESGTVNVPGITGLAEGVRFVKRKGLKTIRAYEEELIAYLHKELCASEEIQIYGPAEMKEKVGIFAFNIKGMGSEQTAEILDKKYGIAVRAGFHCAPLAHKAIGTEDGGCVRISVGCFNTGQEMIRTARAIRQISKDHRRE